MSGTENCVSTEQKMVAVFFETLEKSLQDQFNGSSTGSANNDTLSEEVVQILNQLPLHLKQLIRKALESTKDLNPVEKNTAQLLITVLSEPSSGESTPDSLSPWIQIGQPVFINPI